MVEKIRISVALMTYNGEKYIKEQIESILKNLTVEDEVIISDDGSVDRTLEILEEFQKQDNRIHILQGPQQGIKKNVEYTLQNCSGEYIFLSDQDDIWAEDKVAKVMQIFKQEQCHLVIHDAQVIRAKDKSKIEMESFFDFRNAGAGIWKNIIKNSYIGCCMAFNAELLTQILPIPNNIEMHDQWIGIINDKINGDSYFLKEPLMLYRRHEENNSSMQHYGIGRMIKNRVKFCYRFLQRCLRYS